MTPVLTARQMQALDGLAIETVGIPSLVLMEVAGRGVLDAVLELAAEDDAALPGPVLLLAGTGNNGGDAVVVARHLVERGVPTTLLVLGDRAAASEDMARQLAIAERLGVQPRSVSGAEDLALLPNLLLEAAVVVDGIFGTGLTRDVTGWRAQIIDLVNDGEAPVVAVDLPSGICADTGAVLGAAIEADITVTFQCAKLGHVLHPGRGHAGALRVVDIGIPESRLPEVGACATLVTDAHLELALLPREPDSHKGTYGHVLVVAGQPDRPGAAMLAARAAQRAGAGLVTLGSDAETVRRLAPAFGSLMGQSLGERRPEAKAVQQALQTRTACVIGPSLEPDAETAALLQSTLQKSPVPAVLDAGALAAMGPEHEWLKARPGPTVLTPHPGEMGRLLGTDSHAVQRDRVTAAQRAAASSGAIVVLKGASTVIAEPGGEVCIALSGNPGMATGGTGDVLAGVIGALLGQGVEPFLAACAGAELHARAGDLAAAAAGESALVAEDLLEHIGAASG